MISAGAARRARTWAMGWFGVVTWLLSGLLLAFIVLPIVRLVTTSSVASLHQAADTAAIRDATLLSLQAAAITAGIATVFGVPLAYLLARGRFRGRGAIQAVVDLPLVVPHTVAGIALLFLLGRTGWVGAPAGHLGVSFYGSQWGIVAAMLFVSVPFAVNSARVGFEAIDPRLERAARSLGAALMTVIGLLVAAAFGRRYRAAVRAAAAGCAGAILLDATVAIAVTLAVPAVIWPVIAAASAVRISFATRSLRSVLIG